MKVLPSRLPRDSLRAWLCNNSSQWIIQPQTTIKLNEWNAVSNVDGGIWFFQTILRRSTFSQRCYFSSPVMHKKEKLPIFAVQVWGLIIQPVFVVYRNRILIPMVLQFSLNLVDISVTVNLSTSSNVTSIRRFQARLAFWNAVLSSVFFHHENVGATDDPHSVIKLSP